MRFAVPIFPGSSGMELVQGLQRILEKPVRAVWHTERDLSSYDGILLPGGFSYGDYLRPGALARYSPVMEGIRLAANQGKLVMGMGNGFQILLESGLLPGAIQKNRDQLFRCSIQEVRVENVDTPFTGEYRPGEVIQLPIAHGAGNYTCDGKTLYSLKESGQIVFRYVGENPNGSIEGIAGLVNQRGNVLGTMLRPERAIHEWMEQKSGTRLFTSMLRYGREKNGAV